MEPYLVPMALQKAFHLMRSSRPGPVLIDLPLDVQLAEIDFDIEAYEPMSAFRPAMTRAQAEKALAMLNEAEKPLIDLVTLTCFRCGGWGPAADAAR